MHSSMHGAVCNTQPFKTINDHTYTFFSGSACPRWLDRHNIKHHGHVNTARDTVRFSPQSTACERASRRPPVAAESGSCPLRSP